MAGTAVAGQNALLTEMAMGYFRSRVLGAAARLGVADALGAGERTVEDLAAACQADPAALYRLLRALASFGVVAETSPASFVLTAFGRPLRKDVSDSAWAGVVFWADLLADSWSYLSRRGAHRKGPGRQHRRRGRAADRGYRRYRLHAPLPFAEPGRPCSQLACCLYVPRSNQPAYRAGARRLPLF